MLLLRIAHMAQRRTHVVRAAGLAFEQHVIATQMNFGRLARRLQLFEVTPAGFALLILLVADGLRVGDSFRNRRSRGRRQLFV